MSTFIRVNATTLVHKKMQAGGHIRVSLDCVAALISKGRDEYYVDFKIGIMPDYFYQHEFVATIDSTKQAVLGLNG